jgi:hypothetical protein
MATETVNYYLSCKRIVHHGHFNNPTKLKVHQYEGGLDYRWHGDRRADNDGHDHWKFCPEAESRKRAM